jgi:hypothetical protein
MHQMRISTTQSLFSNAQVEKVGKVKTERAVGWKPNRGPW